MSAPHKPPLADVRGQVDRIKATYESIGETRPFFGVAAALTVVGMIAPTISSAGLSLFFASSSASHFWDLGFAGWLLAIALIALCALPIVRPALTVVRGAIIAALFSAAIFGQFLAFVEIAGFLQGVVSPSLGLYAWWAASLALTIGYFRRA